MEVVEPEMRDPTLESGALVILSIDPVASVADMQDEKASAAAALLRRGRVLVVVRGYDFDHMKPFHTQPLSFTFLCVGRGLPAEPPFACIGLSPDAVHPDSRPPVLPSIPLPWSDCFLHFFEECRSIITRIHLGATGSISTFSEDQMLHILKVKFADHARYASEVGSETENSYDVESADDFMPQSDVVVPVSDPGHISAAHSRAEDGSRRGSSSGHAQSPVSPPQRTSSRPSTTSDRPGTPNLLSNGDATVPRETSPAASGRGGGSVSPAASSGESSLGDIPKLRYRGEVWLDLTTFDDFDPPEYMSGLIASLEEIEKEWANRMALTILADQPRTVQWAADVAAAGSGDALVESEPVIVADPDNDGIVPEDAIEHRLKKETPTDARSAKNDDPAVLPTGPDVHPMEPIVSLASPAVLPAEAALPGQPPAISSPVTAVLPETDHPSRKQNRRERVRAVALERVNRIKSSFKPIKTSLVALFKSVRGHLYVPTPKSLL